MIWSSFTKHTVFDEPRQRSLDLLVLYTSPAYLGNGLPLSDGEWRVGMPLSTLNANTWGVTHHKKASYFLQLSRTFSASDEFLTQVT